MRPRALDLFCGAGGAAMGLHRAGFEVIGVDNRPQPRYPFAFVQGDALKPPFRLSDFDLIWASPPCQEYSKTRRITGKSYPDLVAKTREILGKARGFTVIENVPGAPLRHPMKLCGTMFGLRVIRHRHFECNFPMLAPTCGRHGPTNSHRGYSKGTPFITVAGNNYCPKEGTEAMGIDWMARAELSQAIPPAYSEFIGRAALNYLGAKAA